MKAALFFITGVFLAGMLSAGVVLGINHWNAVDGYHLITGAEVKQVILVLSQCFSR